MSTSETLKKVIGGMNLDAKRELRDWISEQIGEERTEKRVKQRKSGGPKLKLVEKIDVDARNLYGVHGDWVDLKKLRDGDYAPDLVVAGRITVGGTEYYAVGKTTKFSKCNQTGLANVELHKFPDFNVMKDYLGKVLKS